MLYQSHAPLACTWGSVAAMKHAVQWKYSYDWSCFLDHILTIFRLVLYYTIELKDVIFERFSTTSRYFWKNKIKVRSFLQWNRLHSESQILRGRRGGGVMQNRGFIVDALTLQYGDRLLAKASSLPANQMPVLWATLGHLLL